jgi:REP element-mobilizing transposase RayT
MPERLRRLEYAFQRLPIYFVTACTHERRTILNNSDVHGRMIEFGNKGSEHGAWLGAYVLMPDHLHAFVVIDDERMNLSRWLKSLKISLSKTLRASGVPPLIGKKDSSIIFCAAENRIRQNGIMFARIPCAPDS